MNGDERDRPALLANAWLVFPFSGARRRTRRAPCCPFFESQQLNGIDPINRNRRNLELPTNDMGTSWGACRVRAEGEAASLWLPA